MPGSDPVRAPHREKLRVLVVGGGVAALETVLALRELAPELTDVTVIAPNGDFVYRPMAVLEPFSGQAPRRYPLAPILRDAGATLVPGELSWIDAPGKAIHTRDDQELEYDALVLALGASVTKRYRHALMIDDHELDSIMHGLVQDVEGGYVKRLAFIAPARMGWPLPLYELALMTADRARDVGVELHTTIITSEDSPLAIFGAAASSAVADLLKTANIEKLNSSYAEVPASREVIVHPGDTRLEVDRVVALPELSGPGVRGIPLADHGFIKVDPHCRARRVEHIYAAGDITDFPIKHGGISAQQADVVAQSIAAVAGARLTPERFNPVIHGMLLTGEKPMYLSAHITGGSGFSSVVSDEPTWGSASKIAAKYLAPYLDQLNHEAPAPTR